MVQFKIKQLKFKHCPNKHTGKSVKQNDVTCLCEKV